MSETTELDYLKERATRMGIKFHPTIGVDVLKERIAEKTQVGVGTTLGATKSETLPQRNARLRKAAKKLKRVRITCMNPAKKNWDGEFISVGNSAIGTIKEYVPFNAEDGWHLPIVILDMLKDRMYQSFYVKKINGQKVKRSKLVREFAIESLDSLSIPELKTLAAKQAKDEVED